MWAGRIIAFLPASHSPAHLPRLQLDSATSPQTLRVSLNHFVLNASLLSLMTPWRA